MLFHQCGDTYEEVAEKLKLQAIECEARRVAQLLELNLSDDDVANIREEAYEFLLQSEAGVNHDENGFFDIHSIIINLVLIYTGTIEEEKRIECYKKEIYYQREKYDKYVDRKRP